MVDWDPQAVPEPETEGRTTVVFGDADDGEFPGSLPLQGVRWVVSTIPRLDTGRVLVGALRRWGYDGRVAVTVHQDRDAERFAAELEDGRVDLVLNPFDDAANGAVGRIAADPV